MHFKIIDNVDGCKIQQCGYKSFRNLTRVNKDKTNLLMYVLQGFHRVWYQEIVKATGSGVLEDFTFKILEGSDQN